jgi:hypothetical protein
VIKDSEMEDQRITLCFHVKYLNPIWSQTDANAHLGLPQNFRRPLFRSEDARQSNGSSTVASCFSTERRTIPVTSFRFCNSRPCEGLRVSNTAAAMRSATFHSGMCPVMVDSPSRRTEGQHLGTMGFPLLSLPAFPIRTWTPRQFLT